LIFVHKSISYSINYISCPLRDHISNKVQITLLQVDRTSEWFVPKFGSKKFRISIGILFLPYTSIVTCFAALGAISGPLQLERVAAICVIYVLALGIGAHLLDAVGGVMKAASHGAHDANGLTVGIIPQDDATMANEFCDIVIPTGMGLTRDFLNALTADGIIIVGGGSGTLSEVCAAYMYKKPMVAIRNLGGSIEPYIDGFLDHRENIKIIGVDTPQDAVKKILELITISYNSDTESTDDEILDDFNKIKSGEVSRMAQKSSD